MEQEIEIKNKKVKFIDFVKLNKNKLFVLLIFLLLILFSYFFYKDYKKTKLMDLSNKYNLAVDKYVENEKIYAKKELIKIINQKNETYSVLALYFLIDNKLISSNVEINKYFDLIINETSLDKELKNLVIYKKALFNSDFEKEDVLLKILNPLINSDSMWKSHALILMADYFIYKKNEKHKAKEFLDNIILLENANADIKDEAQKILLTEFSQ